MSDKQDLGASALPSGSRRSDEAAERLHPSGFDPSRECNILELTREACPRHGHSHAPPGLDAAAEAVMRARVRYGWTFGKRPVVMAIDIVMAEAALVSAFVLSAPGPLSRTSEELVKELERFGASHNRNGERATAEMLFRAADRIRRLERKAARAKVQSFRAEETPPELIAQLTDAIAMETRRAETTGSVAKP